MSVRVLERVLDFGRNAVAAEVYGPHNVHLERIETLLGVTCAPRGNALTVSGAGRSLDIAERALWRLAEQVKTGRGVEKNADVEAAVWVSRGRSSDGADEAETGLKTRKKTILPRTPQQAEYILRAMQRHDLVFDLAPVGTGKTYLAEAMAVSKYLKGKVARVILLCQAVKAGENLGDLPGDLREKVDPYLRPPLYDALNDMMPHDRVQKPIASGDIEITPLAFMRGRTLSDACVIVDEAQNAIAVQMKMLFTRPWAKAR